jgi:di/tricarboxylate transporter
MLPGFAFSAIATLVTLPQGATAWKIGLVVGLLFFAIVLFATESVSVDIITFCILIPLILTGILKPDDAFRGFSSEAVVSLAAIFVVSGALTTSGVLDLISTRLYKLGAGRRTHFIMPVMLITAWLSAFMNNTTVTAILVPPTVALCRRVEMNPSKLLMPLAFASILGGTCTLIGTSTNIAVNNYLKEHHLGELAMFEFTPIGLVIVAVGILYMVYVGQRLLPDRADDIGTPVYGIRQYLSEIIVLPGSPLIGQRVFESDMSVLEFRVVKIIRGKEQLLPDPRLQIAEGDTLLVEGKVENLMKVRRIEGIEIKAEAKLGDLNLKGTDFRTAEMLVTLQCEVAGRTLREAEFRSRYGLTVLAIYRHGQSVVESLGEVILRVGDVLLVQGPEDRLAAARETAGLSMLEKVAPTLYHPKRGLYAVGFFTLAVALSTFEIVPVSIAFLVAAVATVLFKCINVEKAYEFVDWRLIILIGGMTAFGQAMSATKTDELLADLIARMTGGFGPIGVMAGFMVLTILLTQPMSNAAAALVVLPVALKAADQIGANPHTFAVAVMLAASISIMTPFEPSCILVYAPGKYRFRDFFKVGFGLTIVLFVVLLLLIPVFWSVTR